MPPILTSAFDGVEVKVISISPFVRGGAGADVCVGDVDTATVVATNALAMGKPPLLTAVVVGVRYGAFLRMASQASFTELPSALVESLKMASPSRLKIAILLRRRAYPFPPS